MSVEYVEAGDLTDRPLRASAAPLPSLLMALRDAAGADRAGTPEAWRRVIRAHLTSRDYELLAPLSVPAATLVPSSLLPFPEPPGQTLKDALERILAAEDVFVAELHDCIDGGSRCDWREPARDPRRWLRGLVLALARAWTGFRPIWQAAQEQLAAELDRIESAAARGAHLHVLADLIPTAHVNGERWVLECTGDGDARLGVGERGLTLVPLVAGSRAAILDGDAASIWLVGYPLRPHGDRDATLEALLGIPRARILRVLDEPATNNRLAAALHTVPSAATHHVSALVSAGLVVRDRSDGALRVRRTPRGEALLALYEHVN